MSDESWSEHLEGMAEEIKLLKRHASHDEMDVGTTMQGTTRVTLRYNNPSESPDYDD